MEKQMKELNVNLVQLGNDLKAEMKLLVNKLTEAAVTKLTNQAQVKMSAINNNVNSLITDMKETSRGLMNTSAHSHAQNQPQLGIQHNSI
eukprot:3662962-Ditylum_brightwellii.AAC.1